MTGDFYMRCVRIGREWRNLTCGQSLCINKPDMEEYHGGEEGIELDEEDEKALDKAWANVGLEILEREQREQASTKKLNQPKEWARSVSPANKMNGRTIKIHLPEGSPVGIMTAEITVAWTGKVLAFPRTRLADFKKREESRRAGVYILIGEDENVAGREAVYIGESEDLWQRLNQHDRIPNAKVSKDFWNRTVVITSKDEHLTKSLVRYLESHLTSVISSANRATRIGGTAPEPPKLPESDLADMKYFASQIELILPVLGFNFVVPVPHVSDKGQTSDIVPPILDTKPTILAGEQESPVFVCTVPITGGVAKMKESGGEFVVFTGSKAKGVVGGGFPKGYVVRRDQLIQDGTLVLGEKNELVFTRDVPFKSPSAAASIVKGSAAAGTTTWQVEGTAQTYAQWRASSFVDDDSSDEELLSEELATDPENN